MTLLERMARAHYGATFAAHHITVPWDSIPAEMKQPDLAAMRAALLAAVEPTEEMVSAMAEWLWLHDPEEDGSSAWKAAIQAALSEGE